jgi:DNA-binding transcriptional LysR family regulator
MDRLTAVRAFLRVAETGSFVKAADSLELPRNTVTKLIQSLEAHLRVKLLNRTTRRVSITNDGALYYERMSRVLEEWQEAESELTSAQSNPRGRLRVDMAAAIATQLVIPALPAFHERYPDLQLDIGASDRPTDLVSERVDCVVRAGVVNDPSIVARHLGDLPNILCASKSYLKQHGVPKHPSDFEDGHTLIRYFFAGTGRKAPIVLSRADEQITVQGRHFISVNDGNALLTAALTGLGIVHTVSLIVQPHIDSGDLVPLLDEWSCGIIPFSIVYAPNRHLSARARVFVDWMVQLFQSYPQRIHTRP